MKDRGVARSLFFLRKWPDERRPRFLSHLLDVPDASAFFARKKQQKLSAGAGRRGPKGSIENRKKIIVP